MVDAAGIKTRCWEAGDGEAVVLVHGGGAGADAYGNWRTCVPKLADRFHVVAVDQAYRFGELLPNSWLYVIPHCGHWAMIERPDDFASMTARFVDLDR